MDNIREKMVELLRNGKKEHIRFSMIGNPIISTFEPMVDNKMVEALADHLIAHGVTVQEWIPVTEPPKKNGRYYVNVKMHDISYVKIASFSKESVAGLHDNGWYEYDSDVGFYEVKDVTHWMPLPQPPKGE